MSHFELKNPEFYKSAGRLMLPVVIQQLISLGINFIDNIMIGGLGEDVIAGASFSNQFYSLFQFICMGLGSGAIVLSSQFWGRKDMTSLGRSARMAMQVTLVLCAAFTVVSVAAPAFILGVYTNQPGVITAGTEYLRLLGITFLFAGLSSTATYLLRSTGNVRVPLIGSTIAFFLNIFFNWVFIFGTLGAPKLGLVGAAIGTIIARAFEFIYVFGFFCFREQNMRFRIYHFPLINSPLWGKYFKYALPVLISDTLLGISLSITSAVMGHVGSEISAAASIVNSVVQMLNVLSMGMAGAAAVMVGNTIGEDKIPLAKRQGNTFILITVLFGAAMIPVLMLIEGPYLGIYDVSDTTLAICHSIFICNCMFMPAQTLANVVSKGILRGGGDTRFLLCADSLLVWVVSIPLGLLAANVWGMTPFWIYFFLRIEFPLKGLMCFGRYLTGKWVKVIKAEE